MSNPEQTILNAIDALIYEDIDAMVDAQLNARPTVYQSDYNQTYDECPHPDCGWGFHGLPEEHCVGSATYGPNVSEALLRIRQRERFYQEQYEERLPAIDEYLGDPVMYSDLRSTVAGGTYFGPQDYIAHFYAGEPLPDLTDCTEEWTVCALGPFSGSDWTGWYKHRDHWMLPPTADDNRSGAEYTRGMTGWLGVKSEERLRKLAIINNSLLAFDPGVMTFEVSARPFGDSE